MSDPAYAPPSTSPGGMTVSGEAALMLNQFWPKTMSDIRALKQVSQFIAIANYIHMYIYI